MQHSRSSAVRDFLVGFARSQSPQVIDVDGGFGALDSRYPFSYQNNRLVVTDDLPPDAVIETADAVLGGAGLAHRMVFITDGPHAERCAPAMTDVGYERSRYVLMCHEGPAPGNDTAASVDGTVGAVKAERVDHAALSDHDRSWFRATLPDVPEFAIDQLVGRRAALGSGADRVEFLAARNTDGQIVASIDVYHRAEARTMGGTVQIDDLRTAHAYQRRGHARALITAALRRADDLRAATVFLIAHADDWPRTWYQRLGFVPIAFCSDFLRRPGR